MRELRGKTLDADAAQLLAQLAAGDARVALGGLETAASLTGGHITREVVKQAMQAPGLKYDKSGEYHYNLVSAFIKSMRGGAVDAALYYLARMIEGGEDPKFIARRLLIFASEDIGLADNSMLPFALGVFQAIERIGMPEGRIILSQATIALATAPKDRRAYDAINLAITAAHENPESDVPLHLRNAPTKLMGELGYGKDYKWEAGFDHAAGFMPKELAGQQFYQPKSTEAK
jgi:putative ATPase